jgi:stage III sporulation protein AE
MKRMIWLLLLAAGLLCSIPVAAATEAAQAQWASLDTDAVEEAAEGAVDQPLDLEIDLTQGLWELLAKAQTQWEEVVRSVVRSGVLLLVVVLFGGLASSLSAVTGGALKRGVQLVAALSVTGLTVADAGGMIGLGRETLQQIDLFSKTLLPVMTTACAATGAVSGAAVRQAATLFCSDLLITLIDRVLLPCVYLYISAVAAAEMVGNSGLSALAKLMKWGIKTVLTAVLLVYTGFLSFVSVSTSGADAMTVRLTKTAISGLVPVVGGILSDATETVLVGAGLVRNAIGVFGVLAVLGFCLTPFLYLGMQYLMYRGVAVLAAVCADSGLSGLLEELSGAFGLVLGMTGACALMVLISLLAAMSASLPT